MCGCGQREAAREERHKRVDPGLWKGFKQEDPGGGCQVSKIDMLLWNVMSTRSKAGASRTVLAMFQALT